jgi:hypothetical protein
MQTLNKYAPVTGAATLNLNAITQFNAHKIKHGSITLGLEALMGQDTACFIYCDPPWGPGLFRYWQTVNNKMTGANSQNLSYEAYMEALFNIIQLYADGIVLIEYGQKWAQQLIDQAVAHGLQYATTVELLYRSGSKMLPCDLHVFGAGFKPTLPDGFQDAIWQTHGYNTLKVAFKYFSQPNKIALDPCCGMGYTAQAAIDHGMIFRGNELNAARLQITANRLYKSCKN